MTTRILLSVTSLIVTVPTTALGYIGPGAGITAIGAVIALVGAVLLAIVGFVWYPVKHLLKRFKKGSRKVVDGRAKQGTEPR